MAAFHLQIVTPDRMIYDGEAQSIRIRTVEGDTAILANHIDFAAALGIGEAHIKTADGADRYAACNGGILTMHENVCRVAAVTFEWSDEIDVDRAQKAEEVARQRLVGLQRGSQEWALADAKMRRALTRLHVHR